MTKKSIAKTLEQQRVLIFNSRKPKITPLLEPLGVDSAYLDNGEALYNEVIQLSEIQKKEQQEESLMIIFKKQKVSAKKNINVIAKLLKWLLVLIRIFKTG
ncbi:hypothetical protein ACFLSE_01825 [Bacteroidota bacterium]